MCHRANHAIGEFSTTAEMPIKHHVTAEEEQSPSYAGQAGESARLIGCFLHTAFYELESRGVPLPVGFCLNENLLTFVSATRTLGAKRNVLSLQPSSKTRSHSLTKCGFQ